MIRSFFGFAKKGMFTPKVMFQPSLVFGPKSFFSKTRETDRYTELRYLAKICGTTVLFPFGLGLLICFKVFQA